jgi:hypothetical protein
MSAKITTAAGNENFHLYNVSGQAPGQRIQLH